MISNAYIQQRLVNSFLPRYVKDNITHNLTDENGQKIRLLKNKHAGERCFIVGGSPSLRSLDLSRLNSELVFTTNRGFKLTQYGLMRADYHVMSDVFTFVADNVCDEIPLDFADTFLIYGGVKFTPKVHKVVYFNYTPDAVTGFQTNMRHPLIPAASVICLSIQIAYHMGISEIYLLGVDLDFENNAGHAYTQTEGEKARQKRTVESKPIIFNWLSDASRLLVREGRGLYNASPAGVVNCIPRVVYEDVL